MNQEKKTALGLIDYINKSVTPFHAVKEAETLLKEAGFEELPFYGNWNVVPGGGYYVEVYGKTLAAFTLGENVRDGKNPGTVNLRAAAAHTDYPCLHIKPKAEMASGRYLKLNTEVYGGPILNTWFDRPLSVAGRVAVRSGKVFEPEIRLIDSRRPIAVVPNLAIHMNREVNGGVEIKKQTDLPALLGELTDGWNKDSFFLQYLAGQLDVPTEDILDFDLYLYSLEEGCLLGFREEYISAPRLDNLTSCYAAVQAIIKNRRKSGINAAILYDHEEIGSRSKQGADSAVFTMLLEKLYEAADLGGIRLREDILSGFLLSADVAHALHPNRPEKYDPVNQALMNDGVVIKINSGQKYTFDTEAVASVQQLCDQAGIKYKKFVNHSDQAGGGTLGPIISSWLPMKTVDIGVPMLAMHSARELMGMQDQEHITRLIGEFYRQE